MDTLKIARPDAVLQSKAEADPEWADLMWRYRHPEKDGQKLTLVEVMVELQENQGISIKSLSSISGFYKWLAVRRDFQNSRNVVYQIKEEMRKDRSMTPEAIERAGVVMLATRGIQMKDAKLFSAMMKIGQGRTKLDQNDKRLKQTDQSLEHDARKLAMLEAKAAKADQADQVMGDGKLTEEEKAAKLKQIFRMG
jgi:hypothetical protein